MFLKFTGARAFCLLTSVFVLIFSNQYRPIIIYLDNYASSTSYDLFLMTHLWREVNCSLPLHEVIQGKITYILPEVNTFRWWGPYTIIPCQDHIIPCQDRRHNGIFLCERVKVLFPRKQFELENAARGLINVRLCRGGFRGARAPPKIGKKYDFLA
jgi:hypothetical protein